MSISDVYTEEKLKALERQLKLEYAKSWKELNQKTRDYFLAFEKRDKEYKAKLDSGKVKPPAGMSVEQHYALWRKAQIGRGKRYEALRDDMAKRLLVTNKTAAAYINGVTPDIYAFNHNYSAYTIDKAVKKDLPNLSWTLIDEHTVRELMTENHTEFKVRIGDKYGFRAMRVDDKKDYNWNTKQINSCLTAGIMQGESMGKIADRFYKVMGSNQAAAIRNARTAVTSAQNAGRQLSFHEASDMGIETWKEWMSTLDSRTRDSHRDLDGERVHEDDTFSNGLMYPAERGGEPAEVYNCRCTMKAFFPKYQPEYKRAMTYSGTNAMASYDKWAEGQKNG